MGCEGSVWQIFNFLTFKTMTFLTRRTFLQTTLGTLALSRTVLGTGKPKPRLSFSTLGCPNWPLATVLKSAVDNGYAAVEFRGLAGELDLTKRPEFNTPAGASETRRRFADQGVNICGLGSSSQMHHADATKRQSHLDSAKRYLDMAAQLDCPYVRVFPDSFPKEQEREATLDLMAQGLLDLGHHAKGSPVGVLLESHGQVSDSTMLDGIMRAAAHPQVGLLWDVVNMWADGGESPKVVYQKLRNYIRHVHIKDAKRVDGKLQYVLVGEGEAPLREAIAALVAGGYTGYYSLEWEKKWVPELAEPDVAFPHYPKAVARYF